jgi:hypothetical protein
MALAGVLSALACTVDEPLPVYLVDAADPSAAAGASADNAFAGRGGGASSDATVGATGGSGGGLVDASQRPSPADAQAPPPYDLYGPTGTPCELRCVWRLIRDCVPVGTPCTKQHLVLQLNEAPNGVTIFSTVYLDDVCGERNRVTRRSSASRISIGIGGNSVTTRYYAQGRLCATRGVRSSYFHPEASETEWWQDPAGNVVAYGQGHYGTPESPTRIHPVVRCVAPHPEHSSDASEPMPGCALGWGLDAAQDASSDGDRGNAVSAADCADLLWPDTSLCDEGDCTSSDAAR